MCVCCTDQPVFLSGPGKFAVLCPEPQEGKDGSHPQWNGCSSCHFSDYQYGWQVIQPVCVSLYKPPCSNSDCSRQPCGVGCDHVSGCKPKPPQRNIQDHPLTECSHYLCCRNWQVSRTRNIYCFSKSRFYSLSFFFSNISSFGVVWCYSCIVTGDTQGHITFYNEDFRLLIRYSEFSLGPIVSISFSKECTEGNLGDCSVKAELLIIRLNNSPYNIPSVWLLCEF